MALSDGDVVVGLPVVGVAGVECFGPRSRRSNSPAVRSA